MRKTKSGFQLPPDVSFRKERRSGAWVYVFRQTQLGDLGRIVLQGRPDGRTHVTCEVAGDTADPMTEKRGAIFKSRCCCAVPAFTASWIHGVLINRRLKEHRNR